MSLQSAVIDATGLVVAPGFIDIQSHSIVPLLRDGRCLSKVTQGVTTEIMGEAGYLPEDSPGAVLKGQLEMNYRSLTILTYGGGVNEVQRDLISIFGLGMPRSMR